MSPNASTSRCPVTVRSGSTTMRPARSTSVPAASASRRASGDAATPAAQIFVRAAIRSPEASVIPSASISVTMLPRSGVTPSDRSCRSALAESLSPYAARTRSPASTSRTRALRVSTSRYSRGSTSRASSAICPAISTPVGPAPTTTNVSHASRAASSASTSAASNASRIRSRRSSAPSSVFSSGACSRPVVVAEIRVPRSAGDREHVVRQRLRASVRQVCDGDGPRREVECGRLPEDHTGVLLPAQRVSQRDRNLDRRERARRHLVDERLEEEEVLPVDERHLDVCTSKLAGRGQPAEAPTDDHDTRHDPSIAPSSSSKRRLTSRPPA